MFFCTVIMLCAIGSSTYAEKIYVQSNDGGRPIRFPEHFRKVSQYVEARVDFQSKQNVMGLKESPIMLDYSTHTLTLLKHCVNELPQDVWDVCDERAADKVIEAIRPIIEEVGNTTLNHLSGVADFLLIPQLRYGLTYFIVARLDRKGPMSKIGKTLNRLPPEMQHMVLDKLLPPVKAQIHRYLQGGEEVMPSRTFQHSKKVFSVTFSPDGTELAAGLDDGTIRIWDVEKGTILNTLMRVGDAKWITSVRFSPDGKNLASGDTKGFIRIWDVAKGLFSEH